ncbi:EAL domain-containing protein [Sulfurimonas sp.]|uniref:EAL domain-containing protein n=1 Tax=Sulfurimonas sp. TaxID=2022749 RepID=UPI0025D00140|nr:EAL domain-containing protein [Sulfurimonas sp.]MBW6487549.1 EAL domain-containing protein [Sulfurimonas sp.]
MTKKFIADAIRESNVLVYYQPIIDNKTSLIHKYEALARLQYSNKILLPDYFFPYSKKIGFYNIIAKKILMKIFSDLRFFSKMHVSINIGMEEMLDLEYIRLFMSELKTIDKASRVTVEMVEHEKIDFSRVIFFLQALKEAGVKISLDDFGSGYANFSSLSKINFDYIKIDGSIICNLFHKSNIAIVKFITEYSKDNKIKTIAEYVENIDLHKKVSRMDIDYSQGFYVGEPEPMMKDINRKNIIL